MPIPKFLNSQILKLIIVILLASCSGPRIIPDSELAAIFHDVYLVNAYASQRSLNVDSMNIYEPIFAAHGYTSEDVQHTIGNFSKRKSARLSDDVVDVAGGILRREWGELNRRAMLRDTIALIARNRFADTVFTRDQIVVRTVADTAKVRLRVNDIAAGNYEVSYRFTVDTADWNAPLTAEVWLSDAAGRRSGSSIRGMSRGVSDRTVSMLTAAVEHRRIEMRLGAYRSNMTTPRLTIDSIVVRRLPPDDEALRRLARHSWGGPRVDSTWYMKR